MLGFLRRHQKYFFIIITIVIVISFSFFGTYSTLASSSIHEQVAFTTVDGTSVTRASLDEFARFLSSDQEDSRAWGGAYGPNFLNDGTIKNDFLQTGLAQILIQAYAPDLKGDLLAKQARESSFKPYVHPEAKFISSAGVWQYLAPEISTQLAALQQTKDPLSDEAISAKISLYLAEKKFPAAYLRQMLLRQEQQFPWLPHDPSLDYSEPSLFGYRGLDDWFGTKFTRLISEFIMNAAIIAEQKGYHVTKEEALADLVRNATLSFKENRSSPHFTATNADEYFKQQLTHLRVDQPKAVKIWQQVLLFRRLFHDVGNAVFVDRLSYDTFNQFAGESVTGDLYRIPEALRIHDFQTLQNFESYLDAIAKRSKEGKSSLKLPDQFLSIEELSKRTPELVKKRYLLEVASINKKSLESRITLKELLAWEIDPANWKKLQSQFPDLGVKTADSSEERLTALESLDDITRRRVDGFARKTIADAHPEWIEKALEATTPKSAIYSISLKGPNASFKGLERGKSFIATLDKAPIGEISPELSKVTFNDNDYYRIKVLDSSKDFEVMEFKEANSLGILEELTDRKLEPYYVQIRQDFPEKFQNESSNWKPFKEVQTPVAELYFEPLTKAILNDYFKAHPEVKNDHWNKDQAAPLRFFSVLNEGKNQIEKAKDNSEIYTQQSEKQEGEGKLAEMLPLNNQWKLVKTPLVLKRKSQALIDHQQELFKLPDNAFSLVYDAPNGDLYFYHVKTRLHEEKDTPFLDEQISRARFLLSGEAQQMLLYQILPELKSKSAISFNYLNYDTASMEPEQSPHTDYES